MDGLPGDENDNSMTDRAIPLMCVQVTERRVAREEKDEDVKLYSFE